MINDVFIDSKPSILHIIDTLNMGGAERVVTTLVNLFVTKNHKVGILIILAGENPLITEINNGVNIYLLNRYNKYNPFKCNELISITNNYDIIHVHMRHNLRYLKYASYFSFIKIKKIFFHDHYGNIKNDISIDFITKYIMRNSIYIGVSKELYEWSLKYCSAKESYLLSNIILKEKIAVKTKHINKDKRLLLVSNIHPRKNIEFAIEIMKELVATGEYYLDIIGRVADNEYFDQLTKLISSNSLEDHVTFNSHCNNIQPVLYCYDLALHPSKSETGPLVLIEYLAQSLPFLTFNTGEVVHQIRNEL